MRGAELTAKELYTGNTKVTSFLACDKLLDYRDTTCTQPPFSTIRSDIAHQMYSETANHAALVKPLLLNFWGRLENIAQIGKCGPRTIGEDLQSMLHLHSSLESSPVV